MDHLLEVSNSVGDLEWSCTESFVFVHAELTMPRSRGARQSSGVRGLQVLVPPEFDEGGPVGVGGDDGGFVTGLFQLVLDGWKVRDGQDESGVVCV